MKKAFIFLLVLLILLVSGCGSSADPQAGVYHLSTLMGLDIEAAAVFLNMDPEAAKQYVSVELKDHGKATFTLDGQTVTGTWTLEGENITLEVPLAEKTISGTLDESGMHFTVRDIPVTLTKVEAPS